MLKKIKIMIYHKPFNIPFRRIRNLSISTVKETGVVVPESGFRTWSFIWTHGSFTSCREPYPKVKFWNIISYFNVITYFDPCEILNLDSEYYIILFNWTWVPNFAVSKYYMRLVHTVHSSIYISLLWKANKIIRKKNLIYFSLQFTQIHVCNCNLWELPECNRVMIYTAVSMFQLFQCCAGIVHVHVYQHVYCSGTIAQL